MEAKNENIHTAMISVMKQVGYVKKEGKVTFGNVNYSYAGEAHLIKAIRPQLIEQGIYVYPCDIKSIRTADIFRAGKKDGDAQIVEHRTMFRYTYRFYHSPSQTYIDVFAVGDSVDATDKGAYKAATGAYKYALRQALMIETGNDPEKPLGFKNKREFNDFYQDLVKDLDEAIAVASALPDLYAVFNDYTIELARVEAFNENLYKDFVLTKFENAKAKLAPVDVISGKPIRNN